MYVTHVYTVLQQSSQDVVAHPFVVARPFVFPLVSPSLLRLFPLSPRASLLLRRLLVDAREPIAVITAIDHTDVKISFLT